MYLIYIAAIAFALLLTGGGNVFASSTQLRLDEDIAAGKPIVIQVSVALADNKNQWIAPVPSALGNGQNPNSNLYWGARYGVRTYMTKDAGWTILASIHPEDHRILDRLILKKTFNRNGKTAPVYLVADAWNGKYIRDTIEQFIRYNAGKDSFDVSLQGFKLSAGGKAQLIVYIGHNALMDYFGAADFFLSNPAAASHKPDNDAMVLACKSRPYFSPRLKQLGAHPLLLTTGLMAPEAYSLHAAIKQWISGGSDVEVRKAAASSYHHYQKTGRKAAERLFGVE